MPAFSSDPVLAVTQVTALGAFALAVLTLVLLLGVRAARIARSSRAAARESAWREALHLAVYAPGEARLPPVPPTLLPEFLRLWNHLRESLRGEAGEALADLIRGAGLTGPIRDLARGGGLGKRLAAITAIGHLRDAESTGALAALVPDADPVLSFTAARALLRIAPGDHLEPVLAAAARREDWPAARVGAALQELGADLVTPPMLRLLQDPPDHGLVRLLRLARYAHRSQVAGAIRRWLVMSRDAEVICVAVDFVEDARDLATVRGAAQHADWRVRMAAARALGRIGSAADLGVLLQLLEDRAWWVRHRAAEAIVGLPGLTRHEIDVLRARARDPYAADALVQALAEHPR